MDNDSSSSSFCSGLLFWFWLGRRIRQDCDSEECPSVRACLVPLHSNCVKMVCPEGVLLVLVLVVGGRASLDVEEESRLEDRWSWTPLRSVASNLTGIRTDQSSYRSLSFGSFGSWKVGGSSSSVSVSVSISFLVVDDDGLDLDLLLDMFVVISRDLFGFVGLLVCIYWMATMVSRLVFVLMRVFHLIQNKYKMFFGV